MGITWVSHGLHPCQHRTVSLAWLLFMVTAHSSLESPEDVQPLLSRDELVQPQGSFRKELDVATRTSTVTGKEQPRGDLGDSITPEEEAAALTAEDHDENIERIEAQELAKAKMHAAHKSMKVPDEIGCYWKLVQQMENQKALSQKYSQAAMIAKAQADKTGIEKKSLFDKVEELQKQRYAETSALEDAQSKYKMQHEQAMKAFKTAKGNLDSYDEERKKVDMDSTRAKRVLGAYLKYKKLFIETSSMEAMDSSQSVEA